MTAESEKAGVAAAGVGAIGMAIRFLTAAWRWRRTLGAIGALIEEYMSAKQEMSDGGSSITSYEAENLIQRISDLVTEGVRAKAPVPTEETPTDSPVPLDTNKEAS